MAQIPVGNFGNSVASPGPQLQAPQGNQIGSAINRLGEIAVQGQVQAAADEVKVNEVRQRARANLALATTTNALQDAHDAVGKSVLDGSLPTDQAEPEFQKQVQKITAETMVGFSPDQQQNMQAHFVGVSGTLGRSLNAVVEKRQQSETLATIDQFGEQVSREANRVGPGWATEKFNAMVDFAGGSAGLADAQRAKIKQQFKENVHYNFFDSAGTAALTQSDPAALGKLITQVQGPEGDVLDPQKRDVLTRQLFGYQQSILAKQDRARNAADDEERIRFNAAADIFNKGTDVALGGGYFSPDFIKQMTETAAGTAMEPQVTSLIASQREVAGFATRPASERAQILNDMRKARATPGVGTTPLGDKVLSAVEQMDTKLRQQADDNPWKAAQQAGRIQDVPLINPGNPQEAVQLLGQRMAQIGAVEQWTGKRVSPFQPEEIDNISKMLKVLPVDQASSMLASFGDTLGNSERVAQVAKQMHDKDGTLGLAMMLSNSKTTQGRYTAELVLRGAQAEKDGTVKADGAKETGWKASIANQLRGVYSNRDAEDQVIRAAYLVAGANGGDVDNAVRLVSGGVVDFNGSKVPMPYGMAADGQSSGEKKFRAAIEAITPDQLAAQAPGGMVHAGPATLTLPEFVKTLPDARLMHGGQGVYYVRSGNSLVTTGTGRPLTIRMAP